MLIEEKAKTNTQTIKEQIDRFDNKASILITVVSIVFAISLSMVDVFEHLKTSVQTDETHAKYISLIVFACFYIRNDFLGKCNLSTQKERTGQKIIVILL